MASIPPRAASQRRSSPRESQSQSSTQLPRADSEAFSTTSEDSQTLLLNRRSSSPAQELSDEHAQVAQPAPVPTPSPAILRPGEDDDVRKCWICMQDETEDTPESSEWRSPCKCALTAHEECLLEWIADMEAPKQSRRAGESKQVLCPQCKQQIKISRPTDYAVKVVRSIERVTGALRLPGLAGVLCYSTYMTCHMHGIATIYLIFGPSDGRAILEPLYHFGQSMGSNQSTLSSALKNFYQVWHLHTGVTLIPGLLVASRISLADTILPIVPLIFFGSSQRGPEALQIGDWPPTWPPSAALSFSLLPYIRLAYNWYYDTVWRPYERRWLREIQPRARQEEGAQADNDDAAGDDLLFQDEEDVLEIGLDINIDVVDDDAAHDHHHHDHDHDHVDGFEAHPLNAPPLDVRAADQDAAPAPNVPRAPRQHAARGDLSLTKLADTIFGALLFPSIAASVGELLRYSLPSKLISGPTSGRPTGLLQTRWGRSLIGGCLFVGARDAVMLYVRWRMARSHRARRIVDWDKVRKEYKRVSGQERA